MKRLAALLFLISSITCFAQTQIDPTYQIQWNLLSGSGAPSITCTQNGNYTAYPYGAEWGQSYQDTTNNIEYKCTTSGWVKNLPTTGGTLTGPLNGTSASFSGTVAAGATNPVTIGGATGSCAGLYAKADGTGCGSPSSTINAGTTGQMPYYPSNGTTVGSAPGISTDGAGGLSAGTVAAGISVSAPEHCIGASCITAWPTGGGDTVYVTASGDTTCTTDSAAIQAAINTNKPVRLVGGPFYATGLTMTTPSNLEGDGPENTVIYNCSATQFVLGLSWNTSMNAAPIAPAAVIRNFQIVQKAGVTPTAGGGIRTSTSSGYLTGAHIENIHTVGMYHGLEIGTGTWVGWVTGFLANNAAANGAGIYINNPPPGGDLHFTDTELNGPGTNLEIAASDTMDFTNLKINTGGYIKFTGVGGTRVIRFTDTSIEGASACAVDFGTGANTPQYIQFIGGEIGLFAQQSICNLPGQGNNGGFFYDNSVNGISFNTSPSTTIAHSTGVAEFGMPAVGLKNLQNLIVWGTQITNNGLNAYGNVISNQVLAPTWFNNPVVQSSGGSLTAGTYYYTTYAIGQNGGLTPASTEKTAVVSSGTANQIVVTPKLSWGGISYVICRGTTSGGELKLATVTPPIIGAFDGNLGVFQYYDTGGITPSGACQTQASSNTSQGSFYGQVVANTVTAGPITAQGGIQDYGNIVSNVVPAPVFQPVVLYSSSTGGHMSDGTYCYTAYATGANGGTTPATTELCKTIADGLSTNYIYGYVKLVAGAATYSVCGRTTGSELFMQTLTPTPYLPGTISTMFTDDGTITPSGSCPTTTSVNGTGGYVQGNGFQPLMLYSAAGVPLPTCASGIKGRTLTVSDATTPTYMGGYASGGGITTEVICSYNGSTYVWLTK